MKGKDTRHKENNKTHNTDKMKEGHKEVEKNTANSGEKKTSQFRIIVGSYEHNLQCLSVLLNGSQAVFQPIFHFEAHSLSIKAIDVARRYLVTGSNDELIRIFDLQKRKELGTLLGHQGTITKLQFSLEGVPDNETISEKAEKSGKWLLSASEDGKIMIWRTKDWEMFGVLKGHKGRVNDLAIHHSGRVAVSVSVDMTVRLWNLMTSKKAATLKIEGRDHLGQAPEFVRWSANGQYFIVGLLNQILVYNTSRAKIVKKVKFKTTLMCMENWIIDGEEWLVLGQSNGVIEFYSHKKDFVVDLDTQEALLESDLKPSFTLRGHTNRIKDLALHRESGDIYLISVSSDGKIVVWDMDQQVRDQIAVYDTGERLNCVVACSENIEKASTMKRSYADSQEHDFTESEYETDAEEVRKVMLNGKQRKKSKSKKVKVTLE
ncbi:Piso0_002505 [Millerozyma farinosa CBS 7064]|uniref:Piso0_002505 protein n=1 Tax=Pichia sorbitophila (strain ATCC MYA-4447 / BCRC 22081 / CBS 7064 / NBRC 10061 / NRRL Y-12695) TaxID=559304 RepID=G8YF81_PICSO|nr:Piso0_002505 [Millerozyma farinosa CBS 7064]